MLTTESAHLRSVLPAHLVVDGVVLDDFAVFRSEARQRLPLCIEQRYARAAAAGGVDVQAQAVAVENQRARREHPAAIRRVHGEETVHALRRAIDAAEVLFIPRLA